jgi:hypothetical protein
VNDARCAVVTSPPCSPHPADWHWTAEQLALLGTAPDEEIAARIGKTPGAVCAKRCQRGIPTFQDRRQRG